jgi:hypothetical protein
MVPCQEQVSRDDVTESVRLERLLNDWYIEKTIRVSLARYAASPYPAMPRLSHFAEESFPDYRPGIVSERCVLTQRA